MPVSVIVGGQYGSEGKGKTTSHLVRERGYDVAVRCGGPNSGHTVTINGEQVILQQIPAGVVDQDCRLYLAAGCLIDKEVITDEIEKFDLSPDRLVIDRNAVVIKDEYKQKEKERSLGDRIGSTCTGTGEAVAARAKRTEDLVRVENDSYLQKFSGVVAHELQDRQDAGDHIAIEGTQGFGLSVYHSTFYPKATSRDTTVPGFLSEVGVGHEVSEVIMVVRTFPIRVPGRSGPFFGEEISWETIKKESGYPKDTNIEDFAENTSVTEKVRRVARFDMRIVKQASRYNQPTQIAVMGTDYLNYQNKFASDKNELNRDAENFISQIENELEVPVTLIGTGPKDNEVIDEYDR